MHTTKTKDTTFLHDGVLTGSIVEIRTDTGHVNVPANDLIDLVLDHIREKKLAYLEKQYDSALESGQYVSDLENQIEMIEVISTSELLNELIKA